jgi:purine-nucleoside/S-methyl-5'-thioadenosine phosphorylase / adenosine deaminase
MQEWVGGSHAFVLIAELSGCDENRKIAPHKAEFMERSWYSSSELLTRAGFEHAFFTRRGGVSSGAYGSLNLSLDVGDRAEDVAENRRRVARALGVANDAVCVPRQVHGRGVILLDEESTQAKVATLSADAVVSDGPGLACAVRTADCVPILLACPETRRVGAVHAGWRGVVQNVVGAAIELFLARGSRPERLIAAIGPHISVAAFEVGDDVAHQLAGASRATQGVVAHEGGRPHIALAPIVIAQLTELGVPADRVEVVPGCTFTDGEQFFSYRRDGQKSGRQLSAIVSENIMGGGMPPAPAQSGGGGRP